MKRQLLGHRDGRSIGVIWGRGKRGLLNKICAKWAQMPRERGDHDGLERTYEREKRDGVQWGFHRLRTRSGNSKGRKPARFERNGILH